MHTRMISASILAAVAAGCGRPAEEGADRDAHVGPSSPPVETASAAASMGMLHYREHAVELFADGRYTVVDADGKVLAEKIDAAALAAQFPELSTNVHEAYAGIPLWSGSNIDCRAPQILTPGSSMVISTHSFSVPPAPEE